MITQRKSASQQSRWAQRSLVAALGLSLACPTPLLAQPAKAEIAEEEEAAALSIVAKSKADSGDYATAAELYLQSWRLDGKEVGYLYSAARCYHKANLWDKASETYREFLLKSPTSHAGRPKAEEYLVECEKLAASANEAERKRKEDERRTQDRLADEKRKQQEQAARDAAARELAAKEKSAREAAALIAKRKAEAEAWKTPVGWTAVGVGVVSLAVGAVFVGSGASARGELETDLSRKDDAGRITGVTRTDALSRQSAANSDIGLGSALIGAGVALAGVGGWLLLNRPDAKVALAPNGVDVVIRF